MPDGWFPAETKESRADIAPDESRCEAAFFGVCLSGVAQKMVNNLYVRNRLEPGDEPAGG